jgi:hypothetical protein
MMKTHSCLLHLPFFFAAKIIPKIIWRYPMIKTTNHCTMKSVPLRSQILGLLCMWNDFICKWLFLATVVRSDDLSHSVSMNAFWECNFCPRDLLNLSQGWKSWIQRAYLNAYIDWHFFFFYFFLIFLPYDTIFSLSSQSTWLRSMCDWDICTQWYKILGVRINGHG